MGGVMVGKAVVPAELLTQIEAWVVRCYEDEFREVRPGRWWSARLTAMKGVPLFVAEARAKAFDHFAIPRDAPGGDLADFVNFHKSGGVHMHTDAPGQRRINVMVSKPEVGGNPFIGTKEIEVGAGDAWTFDCGAQSHGSVEMAGDRPRIVLSFGFKEA